MSGRRSVKRKIEEARDERPGKAAKGPIAAELLHCLALETLNEDVLRHTEDEDDEDDEGVVSRREEGGDGRISQGVMWRGAAVDTDSPKKVYLVCEREGRGAVSECAVQTVHFLEAAWRGGGDDAKQATLANLNLKGKGAGCGERRCWVRECGSVLGQDSAVTFAPVPSDAATHQLWADTLDIDGGEKGQQQYVCSEHFVSPVKLSRPRGRPKKKKTCDMLLAEEAEKIKVGLAKGRTKRTPKPNKNYNWAELLPLIKSEPQEESEETEEFTPTSPVHQPTPVKKGPGRPPTIKKEKVDEEEPEEVEVSAREAMDESDQEEYGENVSQPTQPRQPPPKPKGRPPRIRDNCTQTVAMRAGGQNLPLREVKVQCNLTTETTSPCQKCSDIDWEQLESLVAECLPQITRDLCDPVIGECIRKVLASVTTPSHAANFLKLLCDANRDEIETPKSIVLVPSHEDTEEVEIENMIHPEDEELMSGVREITPKTWRRKAAVRVKQEVARKGAAAKREEEEDLMGLEEATEMDDEEFHPGAESVELDDPDDMDDDEEWNTKNVRGSGQTTGRRAGKKVTIRYNKDEMLEDGEAGGSQETSSQGSAEATDKHNSPEKRPTPVGRRRRPDGDTRWIRQQHRCDECNLVFTTQRKYDIHFNHVHLGVAPWQGEHPCDECGKVFAQKISLNVHKMFKHGAPRRYACKKCSYEGPTKEYLKRHMKVHTDERQYVCKECGKGLKTAEAYRNHMTIHTNKGRFLCEVCNKAYNHKGAFEDHLRSHQETREYACNYCGTSFKAYKHVARHIRAIHLNDKRFICDVCGAQHMTRFNLKGHMKKHLDLHSLPYKFECKLCDANNKFRGEEGLAAHMRVVHSVSQPALYPNEDEGPSAPHPTRRPVRFQYSKISSERTEDVETIYVEDENYFRIYEDRGNDENIVYEAYPCTDEGENVVEAVVTSDDPVGERIIHVYTCTTCNMMFTSEAAQLEHQKTCVKTKK